MWLWRKKIQWCASDSFVPCSLHLLFLSVRFLSVRFIPNKHLLLVSLETRLLSNEGKILSPARTCQHPEKVIELLSPGMTTGTFVHWFSLLSAGTCLVASPKQYKSTWSLMVCSGPAAGFHLQRMGLQPEIERWQSKMVSPSCCRNESYGIISSWMFATCMIPKQNDQEIRDQPGKKDLRVAEIWGDSRTTQVYIITLLPTKEH